MSVPNWNFLFKWIKDYEKVRKKFSSVASFGKIVFWLALHLEIIVIPFMQRYYKLSQLLGKYVYINAVTLK